MADDEKAELDRSEIARRAAEARWSDPDVAPDKIEKAQLASDLALGNVLIPCAVLEDGTRVLSERSIAKALGRTRSGSHWQKIKEQGAKLPLYLTADNLKPFISSDLSKALSEPRWYVSTSYAERSNLSLRMHNRRFTRLTNAFSKRVQSHIHMVALYTMFFNFCRIHKTLRVTPAMEAGLTDRVWTFEDIVAKIEYYAPPPKPRGPYKRRGS